ncbi:hypothetical protein EDB83DRAFT_2459924 [Lactarius deliciosus]|nr:hypothetical protein EDB83DRAFT_2459924 [Lactarius deliciosus]
MAALTQFDRVNSISLTLTNSLLGRLSTIADPFSILQELVLLSRDNVQLTLPNTFSWGLRLRTLHLTRITIPTLLQLLSPSTSLVDLQLHEIHNVGYLSPDAFVNALSEMTQLETLSLHFLTLPPRRNYLDFPPQSRERVVLPALTCLKYRGTSKYLDRLVARIDAPHLRDIGITFFNQPTMDASQLGRFIERTEIQSLLSRADIQTSAHDISICCSKLEAHSPAQLGLRILCGQSDWQLSLMTQICNHFSTFLSRVIVLGIHLTQSPSETDDVYGEQWPDLIRAFGGAEDFHVAGPHATDMLSALCTADGHATDTTTLPALCNLHISDKPGPLWDAAQSFIASRRLSGRPVEVNPSFRPRSVGGGCTLM